MPEPESDYTQKAQPVPPSWTEPASGPSGTDPTAAWNLKGAGHCPPRVGRYEVRAVLGEGAFGRVYRAFDAELGREVAIKVPHPQGLTPAVRERFLREARAAAHLHHPNVCPIFDVGTDGDLPFIVMRFIPGGTLAELLASRRQAPPPKFAVATARQLALGVAAAHAEGVIHRDLKPQNALWDESRRQVVITDFGLARVGGEAVLTGQGDVLGTPSYMAPEQARGDTTAVGPLSDVYSLGVILYRLLTGEPPYQGTVYEIMVQAVEGKPRPPSALRPDLEPALDALCLKAMAVTPGNRYPSAKAFADALGAFLKGMDGDEELPVGEVVADPPPPRPARAAVPVAPPKWVPDRPPAVQTRSRTDDPTPRTPPRAAPPPPRPGGSGSSGVVICPRCRARMRIGSTRTKPVPCPMCDCLFSVAAGRQAAARAAGPNRPDGSKVRDALPLAELDDDHVDGGPQPEWRPVAGGLTVAWVGAILAALFAGLAAAFALLTADQRRPADGIPHPNQLLYWLAQLGIGLGAAGGLVMIGVGRWRAAVVPAGTRGGVAGRLAATATLIGTAGLTGGYTVLTRVAWHDGGVLPGDPVATVGQVGCALGLGWLVLAEWFHHRQLIGLARRVTDFPYLHAATTRVLLLLAVVPAVVCVVLAGLTVADRDEVRGGAVYAGLLISGGVAAAFLPFWYLSALWLTGRASSAAGRQAAGDGG